MNPYLVKLYDRVKETTYSTGTGNIELNGAAAGFSAFGDRYANNEAVFYAITDGNQFEVGSGIFTTAPDTIQRFPFRSSDNDQPISFSNGIKEVYVTYPADYTITASSGLGGFDAAQASGVAVWSSSNSLNYDERIIWDDTDGRLGLRNSSPMYALDIGGQPIESMVRASGYMAGVSGISFPPQNNGDADYAGGQQLTHYEMNQLDQHAFDNSLIDELTGSSEVLELSGVVNQYILFKRQSAGSVLAGPPSGCDPCVDQYPSFRPLGVEDMPDLSGVYPTYDYVTLTSGNIVSELTEVSGNLDNSRTFNVGEASEAFLFTGVGTNLDVNPSIRLQKGFNYKFAVRASGYPFYISTEPVNDLSARYDEGITNNGAEFSDLYFTPQMDAPDILYYGTLGAAGSTASGIIYTGDGVVSDPTNIGGASGVNNMVVMSSGAYANLNVYDPNTVYFITDQ